MSPARTIGQPGLMRQINDRAVLSLLLESGPMTRTDIAQQTGLSKPTAAEVIRRLQAADLLTESGSESGRRGPNATLYRPTTERSLGVAVDIQLVDVRATVVDATGAMRPIFETRLESAASDGSAGRIIDEAIEAAATLAEVDRDDITVAAVGIQASVDHRTDSLRFIGNSQGWPTEGAEQQLSETLRLAVLLENDANLAAIAERHHQPGQSCDSFALLWLAEGTGAALDINGSIHAGATGAAGEIGEMDVPTQNGAGQLRLGELMSADAVTRLALEAGVLTDWTDTESDWRTALHALSTLETDHPMIQQLAARIAQLTLPVLSVVDPANIILHGPVGIAGGTSLAGATGHWLQHNTRWNTPVIPPSVVDTPVIHGARHLLIDRLRNELHDRIGTGEPVRAHGSGTG